jgi:RNA polymerase sigma factor (sigma-70 family)
VYEVVDGDPVIEAALETPPRVVADDAELVERARHGDHDAYEILMRKYEQVAFRTALLIVASPADAEDVAQEAFVKAYRALGRFRAGAPFRPWLLRIVGNEARNHQRAAGRRRFHHNRAAALEPLVAADAPETELERRVDARRLLAAVRRLGDRERSAIVARYFVGLTDAEAAAALGVPRTAFKMRAWRGLERLRRELGEEET